MSKISLNGKFLSAGFTAVHRVAEELIGSLDQLVEKDQKLKESLGLQLLTPRNARRQIEYLSIPQKTCGRFTGALWEQLDLPVAARNSLILSFCNLSPLFARNSITMIHDAQAFSAPEGYTYSARRWYQFAWPKIGKSSKKILTISNFSKQQIVNWQIAPEDKIEIVHNGVDHILSHARDYSILQRLGLETGGYALGLANTKKHKNLRTPLQAFGMPELQSKKLVLFGAADRGEFEAKGIAVPPNTVFAGMVTDSELRTLMEEACALVFPSLTEGFGLPPLEAMLLGTPAVCAPRGALPELCGEAAIYIEPEDCPGWARALRMLFDEQAAAAFNRSSSCRQHALQYTWENSGRQLANILSKTVDF